MTTDATKAATAANSRDFISPEAFQVLPVLYGLELARPWRRGIAIVIDALIVTVLAQAGGVLLALAAAVAFFGWSRSRAAGDVAWRRPFRHLVAALGALMLFVGASAVLQPFWERDDEPRTIETPAALTGADAAEFGVHLARLWACDDAGCRAQAMTALAVVLERSDMPPADRKELLNDLAREAAASPDEEKALMKDIDARVTVAGPPAPVMPPEPTPKRSLLAADGSFSLLNTLKAFADDLGFSLGWAAVYFTLLSALWNGQTLGKRWLGIRVIALNGRPLGYREAFDRYGGYAAGFATGLIGFLQVYWDDNRQAIHDKVSFTAVIRDADGQALQRHLQRVRTPAP